MMRPFVKVFPSFWTGSTGRAIKKLAPSTQLVALYLITCPSSNYLGLYTLPIHYIAADTGLTIEQINEALSGIESTGFARYDYDSETVWIVEGAKWQLGELTGWNNGKKPDNRVTMVRKDLEKLPRDCPFMREFITKYDKPLKITAISPALIAFKEGETAPEYEDPYDI